MRGRGRISVLAAFAIGALSVCGGSASAAEEFDKYALEAVSAELTTTQAGAHADLTTTFELSEQPGGEPYALTKDVEVALPPGIIGNPQAIPRCTVTQLGNLPEESECPLDSQVGITHVKVVDPVFGTFTEPVYNMEPPGGDIVARLGFFSAFYPTFVNVRINPSDYSLVA